MTRPRTLLRRLIGRVGSTNWEAARAYAWRTAARTGRHGGTETTWNAEDEALNQVLHDVADAAAYNWSLDGRRRVGLLFALYREAPSYAILMYAGHAYRDLDDDGRARSGRPTVRCSTTRTIGWPTRSPTRCGAAT